jgi:hypothetical protein
MVIDLVVSASSVEIIVFFFTFLLGARDETGIFGGYTTPEGD